MSDKTISRRASVQVFFNGVNITDDITPFMQSLEYTDNETGETDDLQIKLQDRDGVWLNDWLRSILPFDSNVKADNESIYLISSTNGANLRSGPGLDYPSVCTVPYKGQVAKITVQDEWTEVAYNRKFGWIKSALLTPIKDTTSIMYRDYSSGSSSKITMSAVIMNENVSGDGKDQMLDCGTFEIDSITADGPPSTVTLKGSSLSFSAGARNTKKSKAWENCSLEDIANTIATQNGMGVMFSSAYNPHYGRVEQFQKTDIAFLDTLCTNAGCNLKCTNNLLVIFDRSTYNAQIPKNKITFGDGSYAKYKLSTGSADTQYTSCLVYYTTNSGKYIFGRAYIDDYDADSNDNKQLNVYAVVTNSTEAKALASRLLWMTNDYERQATFTLYGNPLISAGETLTLSGFGLWDGNYSVKQAKHSVSSSGYTTYVTLRKILSTSYNSGITDTTKAYTPPTTTTTKATTTTTTVKKSYKIGDTVWFYGGKHYVSSDASKAASTNLRAGYAQITHINTASWAKHPYCLVHTAKSSSTVYGWVDKSSFS